MLLHGARTRTASSRYSQQSSGKQQHLADLSLPTFLRSIAPPGNPSRLATPAGGPAHKRSHDIRNKKSCLNADRGRDQLFQAALVIQYSLIRIHKSFLLSELWDLSVSSRTVSWWQWIRAVLATIPSSSIFQARFEYHTVCDSVVFFLSFC